ncbi:MAG TPA: hypothetical protein VG126_01885 [Thermoleophilaceae bacterium]|nr:hypothetical protein [Thermoleophilaceae bacterium]
MHRLMALGAVSICWLATPTGASAEQPSALDASGLTQQVTGATTGAVASAGAAVDNVVTAAAPPAGPAQDAATRTAGTVARVTGAAGSGSRAGTKTTATTGSVAKRVTNAAAPVAGAAEGVVRKARAAADGMAAPVRRVAADSGHGGRLAAGGKGVREELAGGVDTTRELLAGVAAGESTRGPLEALAGGETARGPLAGLAGPLNGSLQRGFASDLGDLGGGETALAAGLLLGGAGGLAASGDRSLDGFWAFAPFAPSPPLTPAAPSLTSDLPGAPHGAPSVARGTAHAALDLPSAPDPLSGAVGGSPASGASSTFSVGGLALLLATLSLAGPALRRRLPRRPVMGWPAAFVPLLERPG